MDHTWFKHKEGECPRDKGEIHHCPYCDGGLSLCTICGAGEYIRKAVYRGGLNFKDGKWYIKAPWTISK